MNEAPSLDGLPLWANSLVVVSAFAVVGLAASWVVEAASRIAKHLGVSELVVGLTVVALGTSAPEFAVTLVAAFEGHADISVANIVGSNIFNLGFILGGCAVVRAIPTGRALVMRTWPELSTAVLADPGPATAALLRPSAASGGLLQLSVPTHHRRERPRGAEDHRGASGAHPGSAVFRCRDITQKLLTFVRKTEVKLELHELHEIIDAVLDGMLNNELAMSKVETIRGYDPDTRLILTDRNQPIQVILNLVKNAIDAMSGGGVLTVETKHQEDRVVLSVKDTGDGMTATQLEKVFTPFFTTKDPGRGTGLGLSVSLSIVKGLGGEAGAQISPTFVLLARSQASRNTVPAGARRQPTRGHFAAGGPVR